MAAPEAIREARAKARREAQAKARRVKNAVIHNRWPPFMSLPERVFALRLIYTLGIPNVNVSIPYDVKSDPLKVLFF